MRTQEISTIAYPVAKKESPVITIFWTIKQIKFSSEDWRKKQHVYLEHLGRQGWGHTARDHKQINHQQKKEKQESLT